MSAGVTSLLSAEPCSLFYLFKVPLPVIQRNLVWQQRVNQLN